MSAVDLTQPISYREYRSKWTTLTCFCKRARRDGSCQTLDGIIRVLASALEDAKRDYETLSVEAWRLLRLGLAAEKRAESAERENGRLRANLADAAELAGHLFQMIDPQTWRDWGADDGQGHYEGDYRAEKVAEQIKRFRALTVPSEQPDGSSVPRRGGPHASTCDYIESSGLIVCNCPVPPEQPNEEATPDA